MSQFAKILEDNAEKLVERWVKGPGAAGLREHLPQLLRSLIATLRQGATASSDTPAIQFGFDVQGVVREYGALASLLLDAAEESGADISPADVRVFTRFMASAVAQAVAVRGALEAKTQRATEHAAQAADARKDHQHHAELARESMEARRREERLRRLLEAAGAGGWEFDVVARTIDADPSLLELHNVTPSPAIEMATMLATLHPDDRAPALAAMNAALDPNGTRRYHLEYRVLGKGGFRWIEATGRALFDNDDTPMRMIGTAIDITQRKEAELAREGLLEALQANPLLSVTVLEGPELIVRLVNRRSRDDVAGGRDTIGRPAFEVFPHLAGKFEELLKGVLQTGKPVVLTETHRPLDRGDGVLEDHYVDAVLQPLRGRLGTVDSVISMSIDVTKSVHQRRALERTDPLALLELSLSHLSVERLDSAQRSRLKSALEALRRRIDDVLETKDESKDGGKK